MEGGSPKYKILIMKDLSAFLEEILNECDGATPGNTMGMGNVMAPAGFDGEEGSGDIPNAGGTAKAKKQKRRKKDVHPKDKGEDLKLENSRF